MIENAMFSKLLVTLAVSLLTASGAIAQETSPNVSGRGAFSLFENIDVAESPPNTPNQSIRESRATMSEPIFTLVGTSRIGDKRSAILRHQNSEIVRVSTDLESPTRIAGHEDFSVFDVGAGTLSVRYPPNIPCVEHKKKGVSCSTTPNTALLELVNAQALARAEPIPNAGGESSNSSSETSVSGAAVGNPFEALRAARAANSSPGRDNAINTSDDRNSRFTPRRISSEDVPPGMRVVSTPFGDRLVEQ